MIQFKHSSIFIVMLLIFTISIGFAGGSKEDPVVTSNTNSVLVEDSWEFSWQFTDDEIVFSLSAPTTGWVGIGFNPSRMMQGANYILAYVDGDDVYIRDDYGTGPTSHASDESLGGSNDVRLIEASELNGITQVIFALPITASDEFDNNFIQGETFKILLAYGSSGADNFTGMHRSRKSLDVVLD